MSMPCIHICVCKEKITIDGDWEFCVAHHLFYHGLMKGHNGPGLQADLNYWTSCACGHMIKARNYIDYLVRMREHMRSILAQGIETHFASQVTGGTPFHTPSAFKVSSGNILADLIR